MHSSCSDKLWRWPALTKVKAKTDCSGNKKAEKIKSLYISDYSELFGNKKSPWSCENMTNNKKQKKVHKVDFALIYSSQNSIIYGPTRRVIFPIRRTKPVNIGVSSSIMNFSLLPNEYWANISYCLKIYCGPMMHQAFLQHHKKFVWKRVGLGPETGTFWV